MPPLVGDLWREVEEFRDSGYLGRPTREKSFDRPHEFFSLVNTSRHFVQVCRLNLQN